jgi:hypothetical protein|tara:strand:- start:591 stop:1511 length:921 start_codon:yes stop_codon:yes gene_type:complete
MNNIYELPLVNQLASVAFDNKRPPAFSSESELYFDVWERPAYFKGATEYYEDTTHKHIVRQWNDEPVSIGLVGNKYKLLKNREVCEGVEDTLMEVLTPTELENVQRRDTISFMGGTSYRDYIFPNITADIGSRQSDVAFRVIIINGYDGTSSFKFYHGAIDFFCTNGMVTGSYDMIVKRHTSGLTVPKLTDKLRQSVDIFYKQADTWKHWVGKEISDEDAEEAFKGMPNVSERRVQQLMRQFLIECQSHGRTVWALYSASTYYATSNEGEFAVRDTGQNHTASTLMNREQQVRSWLNSEEFLKIAA